MGFLDKAKDLIHDNEEKVDDAIDKVAEVVDEKTGGKHGDKIEKAVAKAHDAVDGLGNGDGK
jgi:hypothetical protein